MSTKTASPQDLVVFPGWEEHLVGAAMLPGHESCLSNTNPLSSGRLFQTLERVSHRGRNHRWL